MAIPFTFGKTYHLFNRGNNRENLFKTPDNYHYFLRLVAKYLTPISHIYSYCLLPNHFHFIIKIKDYNDIDEPYKIGKKKLHQPFSNLFNAYAKAFNKQQNRIGSLFQEHLKRIEVTDEAYLINLIIYIHLNPVAHGICKTYHDYPYSSYSEANNFNSSFLLRDEVLAYFDGIENYNFAHQKNYKT